MKKIAAMFVCALLVSIPALPVLAEGPAAAPEAQKVSPEAQGAAPAAEISPANRPGPVGTVVIGYVDMGAVAKESAPGKAAYATLKSKTEKLQKQIGSREKQLQKKKAELDKQLPGMQRKDAEAKVREFQKQIEAYQKFVQNADKELRAREEELLGALFKTVNKVAGEYANVNGLTAVLMKNQILFTAPQVETRDITSDIIKRVDATEKK